MTFIIVVFCLVDNFVGDLCRGRKLRQRGPRPILVDSEVLATEIVGELPDASVLLHERAMPSSSSKARGRYRPAAPPDRGGGSG
jgi:hypothetical protein